MAQAKVHSICSPALLEALRASSAELLKAIVPAKAVWGIFYFKSAIARRQMPLSARNRIVSGFA